MQQVNTTLCTAVRKGEPEARGSQGTGPFNSRFGFRVKGFSLGFRGLGFRGLVSGLGFRAQDASPNFESASPERSARGERRPAEGASAC